MPYRPAHRSVQTTQMNILLLLCVLPFYVSSRPSPDARDILITVKTTRKFHYSRLKEVLDTWYNDAPNDIYFITDSGFPDVVSKDNDHVIPTKCLSGHTRKQLSCKMDAEIELWRSNTAKWYCHFDDDNYVNIQKLRKLLSEYDHTENWYLGKASTATPFVATNDDGLEIEYWFGTGGAGICLSKSSVSRMFDYIQGQSFQIVSSDLGFPDDVTLGYIMNALCIPLTNSNLLHSHLENLSEISEKEASQQVSLSGYNDNKVIMKRRSISYMKDLYAITHQ